MEIMRPKSSSKILLALILILGTVIRLFRLGYQSEWNDEALSVNIAKGTVEQILTNQFHSRHPPGYYLLLHYWLNWFGDSEMILRLLSAITGIISLFVMYQLAKRLFTTQTALVATAVTAFMPFHLFYSQETRSYSFVFLFSALLMLAHVEIWQGKSNRWWFVYLLTGIAGMYTHYFFALIIGTMGLYFLVRWWQERTGPSWRAFIATHTAMVILYLPMLSWVLSEAEQGDYNEVTVELAGYLSLPLTFTVGQFLPQILIMVGFGLILFLVIITLLQSVRALKQTASESPWLIFSLMGYWVPVTLLYIVSIIWLPLTTPRLMITAVPGLYLFLAWGATMTKEKTFNLILVLALIVIGLIADYNWLFNPLYQRTPIEEFVALLEEQVQPDERIIYANDSGFRLFHRYAPQLDHALYYDAENPYVNTYVRPDVIRLIGGGIVTPEDRLTDTFWLVQHFDFDRELQEDIFEQFESRYQRLDEIDLGGARYYRYQAKE